MRTVPVYFEEDTPFWNAPSPDGMFSNWDQLTNRHDRRGHFLYVSGDVELGDFPRGPRPETQDELGDFTGNDIYAFFSLPLRELLPPGSQMIATEVASTFFAPSRSGSSALPAPVPPSGRAKN